MSAGPTRALPTCRLKRARQGPGARDTEGPPEAPRWPLERGGTTQPSQRASQDALNDRAESREPGCGWGESNSHGLSPQALRGLGVYQFRHTRTVLRQAGATGVRRRGPATQDAPGRTQGAAAPPGIRYRNAAWRTKSPHTPGGSRRGAGGPGESLRAREGGWVPAARVTIFPRGCGARELLARKGDPPALALPSGQPTAHPRH